MDSILLSLDDDIKLKKTVKHNISVVVDRLVVNKEDRNRIVDALELSIKLSDGLAVLKLDDEELLFSSKHSCPICGFTIPDLDPKLFSFNSPAGACDACGGLGFKRHINPDLLIPDQDISIEEGALRKWAKEDTMSMITLLSFLESNNIKTNIPFKDYTDEEKNMIYYGSDKTFSYTYKSKSTASVFKIASSTFEGVVIHERFWWL